MIGRTWSRLAAVAGVALCLTSAVAWAAEDVLGELKPVPGHGAGGAVAAGDPASGNNSLGLSAANDPIAKESPSVFAGTAFGGSPTRFWFRGEYAYYWTSGMQLPPLVTTGPYNSGLTSATDPVTSLGRPDTTILYGNNTVLYDGRSGFYMNTGFWIDRCRTYAVEFDWLDLGPQDAHFSVSSNAGGSPAIGRPYYDVQAGREWRELVSYPGTLSGTVSVDANDHFNSAGVTLRKRCVAPSCHDCCPKDPCDGCCQCGPQIGLDLLVGYRYYGLSDNITIRENLLALSAPITGTRIQVTDSFRAANEFHGVDIGLSADVVRGKWTLSLLLKAALGNNYQTVNISGQTIVTDAQSNSITYDAGVYATRTNIGTYHKNDFVIIPELGLQAAYDINCHWRVYASYNILYWASVMRSAAAIDLNVDPRNIPGGLDPSATHFPQFEWCGSNFWAQGLRAGLEFRF